MALLIVLAGLIGVLFLTILWIKKKYSLWKDMGALYEEPHFFYGNLKGVGKDEHIGQRLQTIYEKFKGKSPFVGMYIFFKPAALLVDLDLVKSVLIKDFNYFHDRGAFYNETDEPISAHMFALSGRKWKLLRNKLSPTFTSGKMKMMFPIIVDVAKRFESIIKDASLQGTELNIKKLMARFTIEVIGTCAFGLDCNSVADENSDFYRIGFGIFNNPRHSFNMELLLLSCRGIALKLRRKRFRDEVSEFYTKVFKSTLDYRISNDIHRNDFMELLINLYKSEGEDKITFNELLAQAFLFFVAGFETTSTTLQFCFYELAANPNIQTKLRDHILEILKKHNDELTYEAMMDMKYLDQVINETLRLYPPVMTLFREADRDYQVPGTKFVFKKGISIVIPAFVIQRDPDIYPNPLKFDPDRFSEENMRKRPAVAFLPFGEGPRICIGTRFGMMQARIGLITALRRFKYTLSPKTQQPLQVSNQSFITGPVGGIWVNIESV